MYRIDSVIHGITNPLNHSAGSWVNGVYPSGGTQLNKKVSCRALWVIMLAIWPTQKTGAEMPIRATTISSGAKTGPRSWAAAIPTAIASTTQRTAAPKTSDRVAGVAAAISGTTFTPWLEEDSRSRVMKIFFLMMSYAIA